MRPGRVCLCLGVAAAVGVFVWAVPLPCWVEGVALVEADPDAGTRVVVPDSGGFLRHLFVRDGQRVREGDVLAVLSCPKLEIALRVNEADQGLRGQQQSALVGYLAESRLPGSRAAADLQEAEFETQALRRQHAMLREQSGMLTLRAPCAGVVLGLQAPEQVGKWLDKGTDLCRVGNDRALRGVLVLGPAERELLRPGSPARLRVHGCGTRSWPGAVARVAQADARAIPPQLSNHAGGEVPTQQDPVSRQEQPRSQQYLVSVQLEKADHMIHPGVLGRVRIDVGSETILWRLQRYLGTTFNWGL